MSLSERWPVRAGDGHQFELLVEVPENPRAVLLFACAMGVDASYYVPFAEALSAEGILLAMCDLRGHGTSSLRPRRGVDFGYRECVELDIPAAHMRWARDPNYVVRAISTWTAERHSIG
jgi:predicted alpha/beta hydrolase